MVQNLPACSLARSSCSVLRRRLLPGRERPRRRPSVGKWKRVCVRDSASERVCLSLRRSPPPPLAAGQGRSLPLSFVACHNLLDNSYYKWKHLPSELTDTHSSYINWYQKEIICYFCCRHREGGLTCGRPSWREGELPESRANGRRRARSPSSSARRTNGGRAGERAIQRTTFASHGPLEGSTEGRKNEAKPLQLPLFHPLAPSLASNTTLD